MQRLIAVIGLQVYAVMLALWQLSVGLRTDEAKYLLNIPYPHPPVARYIMGLTDFMPGQELTWRIIRATLIVQAVWLVWSMTADQSLKVRRALAVSWLLSAAVVLQAGTIMMATLTALQALVFIWLLLRPKELTKQHAGVIGLFWLLSLFTAYQAVLFAPIVWIAFRRTRSSVWLSGLLFLIPIGLLGLYTLSNPLSAASMISHSGGVVEQSFAMRLTALGTIWLLGGSIVLSILGTVGTILSRRWSLIFSLLLVFVYLIPVQYEYYAILFTPLFIAGTLLLLQRYKKLVPLLWMVPVGSIILLLPKLSSPENIARDVLDAIGSRVGTGVILINGSFGHEWQYGSHVVRRYNPSLIDSASAVVCLEDCAEMRQKDTWAMRHVEDTEVWLQR